MVWNKQKKLHKLKIRGALDNLSLICHFFFFKKSWDCFTIRSVYVCSDCMRNLTCKFNLVPNIFEFFLQQPFLKLDFKKWSPLLWLLNLAPSTIILVLRKNLNLTNVFYLCSSWTDTKNNWKLCTLWHFDN